jgi:hypothetical protein
LGRDRSNVVVNDKCHKFLLDGSASKDPSLEGDCESGKPKGLLRELVKTTNFVVWPYLSSFGRKT